MRSNGGVAASKNRQNDISKIHVPFDFPTSPLIFLASRRKCFLYAVILVDPDIKYEIAAEVDQYLVRNLSRRSAITRDLVGSWCALLGIFMGRFSKECSDLILALASRDLFPLLSIRPSPLFEVVINASIAGASYQDKAEKHPPKLLPLPCHLETPLIILEPRMERIAPFVQHCNPLSGQ
jgi:hypothetical protein